MIHYIEFDLIELMFVLSHITSTQCPEVTSILKKLNRRLEVIPASMLHLLAIHGGSSNAETHSGSRFNDKGG